VISKTGGGDEAGEDGAREPEMALKGKLPSSNTTWRDKKMRLVEMSKHR
jgi:hypothetical protein